MRWMWNFVGVVQFVGAKGKKGEGIWPASGLAVEVRRPWLLGNSEGERVN